MSVQHQLQGGVTVHPGKPSLALLFSCLTPSQRFVRSTGGDAEVHANFTRALRLPVSRRLARAQTARDFNARLAYG